MVAVSSSVCRILRGGSVSGSEGDRAHGEAVHRGQDAARSLAAWVGASALSLIRFVTLSEVAPPPAPPPPTPSVTW